MEILYILEKLVFILRRGPALHKHKTPATT